MSNELAPIQKQLPAAIRDMFNPEDYAGDLSDGVSGGFSVISFRGKVWRKKVGGEENPILDPMTDEPVPSIVVVMVRAAKQISKIYYGKKYSEGDDTAPDCMSVDGIKPDLSSPKVQAPSCAACPHNQWGSRITEAGKKAKACSDSRRIAVVPVEALKDKADPDLVRNEEDGGVVLLRVPAMSLQDLATFGKAMDKKGYPYNIIATRIGFDPNASYPRLTFKAVRPLTEGELEAVAEHLQSDKLRAVLDTAPEMADAKPAAEEVQHVDTDFEDASSDKEEEGKLSAEGAAAAITQAKAAKAAKANMDKEAAATAKQLAAAKEAQAAAAKSKKGNGETTSVDAVSGSLDSILSELDGMTG